MKIKCCWNCEDRYVGCHARCKKYIAEKAEKEHERQVIFANKGKQKDIDGCGVARSIRAKKYTGRK